MTVRKITSGERTQALVASTLAFTVCFAVWTIFSIIGVRIKADLELNDTQFGILIATPVLTGSLSRIFLGVWSDQYGGRLIFTLQMIVTAVATALLTIANSYPAFLVAALGVGLAGGSFAVGIQYVSTWYPEDKKGTALGIFGVGNVGAAITNFAAPILLLAMDNEWRHVAQLYAAIIGTVGIVFYLFTKNDPALQDRRDKGIAHAPFMQQLEPLKDLRVWRFALYYFFVFGAFVALALWLPRYYVGAYDLDLKTAGMLAACYAMPGSIFRALGGWLSDKVGARTVMYWTFIACVFCTFIMSYPATDYIIEGIEESIEFNLTIPLWLFVGLSVILGFFMSLGKAAVYKHIPVYYPDHVGSVGGTVGLVGGLGGFFLPIVFGMMNDLIGIWTSCFMLLTLLIIIALTWMHFTIRYMEQQQYPKLRTAQYLPELATEEEKIMAFLESEALKQHSELLAKESKNMENRAKKLKEQSIEMLTKSKRLVKI